MAISETFKRELGEAIGSENILMSSDALERYAKDETHGLKPALPQMVVFPKSHDEVVRIAQICTKYKIVMTPRGAGTGKSGGCVAVCGGVVVDFSKLNKVVSIDFTDLIATVEPGVILGDFQTQLEALGLFYPPDPASLEWCTIGGNVAENAGGPCAVKYGVTKDYVLGLRIVLSDGRNFRIGKHTIKGVTGLDLVSLLCGSEGQLAFVTEITLRLLAKPKFEVAALLHFSSAHSALLAVPSVRACSGMLKCIEFMDAISLKALRNFGFELKGLPDGSALLLIELDGNNQELLLQELIAIEKAAKREGYIGAKIASDEQQRKDFWNMRRQLSEATKTIAQFKVSEDIVVPLSKMSVFLSEADEIAARYGMSTCSFGHAGDGNLHLQIFFDDEKCRVEIPNLLKEVFETTLAFGGTLSGEHGIGVSKKDYLPLEQELDLIDLQRQLKLVFDPLGLLNPGKFL